MNSGRQLKPSLSASPDDEIPSGQRVSSIRNARNPRTTVYTEIGASFSLDAVIHIPCSPSATHALLSTICLAAWLV